MMRCMTSDDATLNDYLDEWFALLRTRVQPTTWFGYTEMARIYLRPQLGALRLSELTVRRLNLHYLHLAERGGRRGGPLSRRTVAYAHSVLHKALADGVREGVLTDNVASRVTLPRIDPASNGPADRVQVWDAVQTARFLELTAGRPLHALWRVALGTGMRRGELLGLRWEDVDLTTPQLRVSASLAFVGGEPRLKTTKTGRSRILHLDAQTAAAIASQPRHDSAWPLVFTTPEGGPWDPHRISDRWRHQWPKLELPKLRLHDLRHCHATLLLDQGVPIKVVSARLGHTTIAMTMDLYAHVLPAQDHAAAAAIERALDGTSGATSQGYPVDGRGEPQPGSPREGGMGV